MPLSNILVSAILVALAFVAYRLLFVGGIAYTGRLKCVAPTQAWIRFASDDDPATRIRVALSFFLAARRANPAPIESMDLVMNAGGAETQFQLTRLADFAGAELPLGNPVRVVAEETAEVVAEFSSEEPGLESLLAKRDADPTGRISVKITGSRQWRTITSLRVVRHWPLDETQEWQPLEPK